MVAAFRPRVVLMPGALGSELLETSGQARPEALWGTLGSLLWLRRPQEWQRRITSGNGREAPGSVRPGGLLDVDVRVGRYRIRVQPYAGLLAALRRAGADVLTVPYDWRLSVPATAGLLQRQIQLKWFGGQPLDPSRPPRDHERITFIGHSLGGLVVRHFVESARMGRVLCRDLVTVGTPHLGAPQAYLHLIGRTLPLPENPFYRELAAASPSAQLVPGRIQTAVFRFMASAFQVLPVYNFVMAGGRVEPYADTYRPERHAPTGRSAMDLIGEMRNGLTAPVRLDEWVDRHDLGYHFLAGTGAATVTRYDRDTARIVSAPDGDGTVPTESARLSRPGRGRLHLRTLDSGGLGRHRLCERADVQAYCVDLLRPRTAGIRTVPDVIPPDDLVAVARTIMSRMPRWRGEVLTITRLASRDGQPLVDGTRLPGPPRPRLLNPPRHLAGTAIFEAPGGRHGNLPYVWILSNERAAFPVGGMLFLPGPGRPDTYLATFNVGQLDTRDAARCGNAHHAESQVDRWIREQPPGWRARIGLIHVANRSRRTTLAGYGPCNPCCVDLADLLNALAGRQHGRVIDAALDWRVPYERNHRCGHPTDRTNLMRLKVAGWQLSGPGA